jgi:predicted nucleic acid-binding protein
MIVADTNILSTFARIQRLELLPIVVANHALYLSPAVVKELHAGLNKGLGFLQPIVDGLTNGIGFFAVELTIEEKNFVDTLPSSLNAGEKECIAICALRAGGKLLTNDKRAHNYCRENRLPSLDLKLILRRLWQVGHYTKEEVRALMDEIERSEPGMTIKGKDEILR